MELYESYYLNFISPIPRSLLEDIAQASISANCVTQINKVKLISKIYSIKENLYRGIVQKNSVYFIFLIL